MTDLANPPAQADALQPIASDAVVDQATAPAPASAEQAPAEPVAAPENTGDQEPHRDQKTGRFAARTQQLQTHISSLVAEKGQLERRVADLQTQHANLTKQLQSMPAVDPNDFAAAESHRLSTVMKTERLQETTENLEQAKRAAMQATAQTFYAKADAARDRIPTIDQDIATFNTLRITPEAAEVLAESDRAPEIAVWLARNPQEAERIYRMPIHKQSAEITRIEARVSAAPIKRISSAPAPLQTVSGASTLNVPDPSKMNMADYEKWRAGGGGRA